MTEPLQPATSPPHAVHDRTLVAALAARDPDLSPSELAGARAQLASCSACTDLLADLVALQVAIPTAAIPVRPRDFTLSRADAARLQPRGWRRLVGFFGSARDGFSRPLALGFTTLGIAGLLVATMPTFLPQDGAGGAATLSTVGARLDATMEAAPAAGAESTDLVTQTDDGGVFAGANPEDASASGDGRDVDVTALEAGAPLGDGRTGMSVLIVVAGAMLIMGLVLFGLRWSARRINDT